ncbi:DNA polymerase II large subunit, partial [Candidatus Bathyarchaeota archaeon]|nr:DNA polymerase II large subunit [Candidatus Bathyarchaeota archaeon]
MNQLASDLQLSATTDYNEYLASLKKQLLSLYEIAHLARSSRLDPTDEPEPYVARDLAEMVDGLVGPKGVAFRIRHLIEAEVDKYEIAFIVASDIVHAKYGHTEPEKAAEQAIRTALAIMTGGITAAPVQGIAHVRIKENFDGTHYLAVYFAGPIRSAGGTEQALILVLADYVRRILGLEPYKSTDVEIRRFVEELRLYEREVSRFQYHVPDDILVFALQNLPVEATGTETDRVEVSSYRNLPRIETNAVRAGGLRVVNDGIIGRAQKVLRIVEAQEITGWDWLGKLKEEKRDEKGKESAYMEDIIAGRPIFAFPSRTGGFRLRYGRARNTGLAALGVHPATMGILGGFLASGTQMRIEGPGKGCVVLPVDTIEPPIVKLKDGSVRRIETFQDAVSMREKVSEILFLGDLLVSFSEFLENNKSLSPSGYTEEWWAQELRERVTAQFGGLFEEAAKEMKMESQRFQSIIENPS